MKIRKRLGLFLSRWPRLHQLAVSISLQLTPVYIKELFIGTRAREKEWAEIHLIKRNDWGGEDKDVIKSYRDSIEHPHRSPLIDMICSYSPDSILEVGCNCGPNLYLLARRLPYAQLYGIDINRVAIEKASKWFAESGITNVHFNVSKADELGGFQDRSIDVVFTDAVLIFVGSDKILKVAEEMLRVARKGLVLVEWYNFKPGRRDRNGLGVHHSSLWKRDYTSLMKRFPSVQDVKVAKMTKDIWDDLNWSTIGAYTRVYKNSPEV